MSIQRITNCQEFFSAVLAISRKMTKPCLKGGCCAYRGDDDDERCFIGGLINDERYDPKMDEDDHNVLSPLIQESLISSGVAANSITVRLQTDLQAIHDETSKPAWERKFEIAALNHGLQYI